MVASGEGGGFKNDSNHLGKFEPQMGLLGSNMLLEYTPYTNENGLVATVPPYFAFFQMAIT